VYFLSSFLSNNMLSKFWRSWFSRISDLILSKSEAANKTFDETKRLVSSSSLIFSRYLFVRIKRSMSHGSSCSELMRSRMMACQLSLSPKRRLWICSWPTLPLFCVMLAGS